MAGRTLLRLDLQATGMRPEMIWYQAGSNLMNVVVAIEQHKHAMYIAAPVIEATQLYCSHNSSTQ